MQDAEVYKFQYIRRQGLQRTYDVMLNVVQWETGICAYEAWVHYAGTFKGSGLAYPLRASSVAEAATESRDRIENNIEDLAGVAE